MLIPSRGFGLLNLAVPAVMYGAGQLLSTVIGGPLYADAHPWVKAASLAIAGVALLLISRALRRRDGQKLMNKQTGAVAATLSRDNSLLWLPMEAWAGGVFVLSVVSFIAKH